MPITVAYQVKAPALSSRLVRAMFRRTARVVRYPKPFTVSVVVVSEIAMRQLNGQYRNNPTVTDILSFPYSQHDGELVICYAQAVRQAEAKLLSVRQELSWLLVHGLLHVLGYDHEKPAEAKRMRSLEHTILNA